MRLGLKWTRAAYDAERPDAYVMACPSFERVIRNGKLAKEWRTHVQRPDDLFDTGTHVLRVARVYVCSRIHRVKLC